MIDLSLYFATLCVYVFMMFIFVYVIFNLKRKVRDQRKSKFYFVNIVQEQQKRIDELLDERAEKERIIGRLTRCLMKRETSKLGYARASTTWRTTHVTNH